MVDKKHLKIGIAVFAIAALAIGLSVGLTQKSNKSTNNASSSQAYSMYDVDYDAADCVVVESGYGKSGKSSSESGSSKSGKSSSSDSDRRALYVPGTEDAEASAGIRRKLRDELLQRGLGSKSYKAGKGQQKAAASSKSGKAACYCVDDSKSGKSESSGKSGKSESSGKSGKSESSGKSGKSEGYDDDYYTSKSSKSESDSGPDSSKSGKSDSAGTSSGCGKSGKYGDCSSPKSGKSAPTVGLTCSQGEPPEPTETFSTPPGTETFSTTPIIPDEFIPSPSPTEGGTTTVATEKDAPEDTQGDRPFD